MASRDRNPVTPAECLRRSHAAVCGPRSRRCPCQTRRDSAEPAEAPPVAGLRRGLPQSPSGAPRSPELREPGSRLLRGTCSPRCLRSSRDFGGLLCPPLPPAAPPTSAGGPSGPGVTLQPMPPTPAALLGSKGVSLPPGPFPPFRVVLPLRTADHHRGKDGREAFGECGGDGAAPPSRGLRGRGASPSLSCPFARRSRLSSRPGQTPGPRGPARARALLTALTPCWTPAQSRHPWYQPAT